VRVLLIFSTKPDFSIQRKNLNLSQNKYCVFFYVSYDLSFLYSFFPTGDFFMCISPIFTQSTEVQMTLSDKINPLPSPYISSSRYTQFQDQICTGITLTRHGYLFSRVVYTNSSLHLPLLDAMKLSKEAESGPGALIACRVNKKILELQKQQH
jgi:hypothetical protein